MRRAVARRVADDLEGERLQRVPGEDGRTRAERLPHGGTVPAFLVAVHDVVVHQAEGVQQFHGDGGGHGRRARAAHGLAREDGVRLAHSLPRAWRRGAVRMAAEAARVRRGPPGRGMQPGQGFGEGRADEAAAAVEDVFGGRSVVDRGCGRRHLTAPLLGHRIRPIVRRAVPSIGGDPVRRWQGRHVVSPGRGTTVGAARTLPRSGEEPHNGAWRADPAPSLSGRTRETTASGGHP